MNYNQAYSVYKGDVGCLMIHGFTGTPWTYSEIVPELVKNNISVEVPLLPGHGTNPKDLQKVKWQDWYNEAANKLNSLKRHCTRVFIVGHSVGGAIALLIAARNEVNGVVSLSTPVELYSSGLSLLPFFKFFIRCIKKRRSYFTNIKESGYNCYPTSGILECVKLLETLDKETEKIKCPALFIHDRGDKRISFDNLKKLIEKVPSTSKQSLILEHTFHMITKGPDKEKVFNKIISFIIENSKSDDLKQEG